MKNNLKNINLFAKRALTTPPCNSQINSATLIGSISVVDTTVSDLSQTRVLPTVDRRSNYTSSTSCATSSVHRFTDSPIHRNLKKVAMLLCVLMLGIGQMWGAANGTYSNKTTSTASGVTTTTWDFGAATTGSSQKITSGTVDNGIRFINASNSNQQLASSGGLSNKADSEIWLPVSSATASGTVSMTTYGTSDSRWLQLYVGTTDAGNTKRLWSKYNETPTSDGKKGPQSFEFAASDLTKNGDNYYLKFESNNTEMKVATLAIAESSGGGGSAPSITTQPTSVTNAVVGTQTSLTVVASNATGYQWQSSSSESGTYTNISSGGTSATLHVTPSAEGTVYYKCVVSNSHGSITSDAAHITATSGGGEPTGDCPKSGVFFSVAFTATHNYSLNTTKTAEEEITSSYATTSDGKAYAGTNKNSDQTISIKDQSSSKQFYWGSNNTYLKLKLDCELQAGDTIKFESTTNYELSFTLNTTRATTPATSSKKYIVSSTDGLAGKNTIYVWRASGSSTYGHSITITRPASTYTVTFDANGGSVTPTSATQASEGAAISLPTPTKTGYTCSGWYTAKSGGTKRGNAGGSYTPSASETIYAQWTPNKHTLTWNTDGGTITSADNEYTHGEVNFGTTIVAPKVEKDDFDFDGWNTMVASTMPDDDVSYTAQWKAAAPKFDITFNNGGHGTAPSTTTASNVTLAAITGVTGYTCTGWKANVATTVNDATVAANTLISNGTQVFVSQNTTFTAQWEIKSYPVSKNPINCSFDVPQSVEYGGSFDVYVTPNTGYNLPASVQVINATGNWNQSTGELQVTNVTGQPQVTVTCVAKTTAVTLDANTANHGSGSNSSVTATYGAVLPSFTACTPETNYVLDGYYTAATGGTKVINADGTLVASTTYADGNSKWKYTESPLTLYAQYINIPTELSELESGVLYKPGNMLPYGKTISSSSLYVAGLSANGKFFIVGDASSKDGAAGVPEIKTNTKVTYDNIDFTEFLYFKGAANMSGNTPTSRAIKFILPNDGTLNIYGNGSQVLFKEGASSTTSVTSGAWSTTLTAGTYYLYATAGSKNIVGLKFTRSASSDATLSDLKVDDQPIPSFGKDYVSYNVTLPVGKTIDNVTITATANDANATVGEVTKSGKVASILVTAEDGTTKKTYTITFIYTYTLTFDSKGGSDVSSQNIVEGNHPTAVTAPTKTGYTFAGWYDGDNLVSDITTLTITGNKTLTAHWTENLATISLVASPTGAGTFTINSQAATSAQAGVVTKPAVTAVPATGYDFTSWAISGGSHTITTNGATATITGDGTTTEGTLTATFTAQSYNVTLNTNGGTINAGNITSYTYGVGATLPTDVTKAGYTFDGWFDNSGLTGEPITAIANTATGEKAFWAKWTAIPYTITYDGLKEGANAPSITSYTVATATFALPEPTNIPTGYVFDGWYLNNEGSAVTEIALGSTGDKSFTAHWKMTITYDMQGHGTQIGSFDIVEGAEWGAPTAPTAYGWNFLGWHIGSADGEVATSWTPTAPTTLFAEWEENLTCDWNLQGTFFNNWQLIAMSKKAGHSAENVAYVTQHIDAGSYWFKFYKYDGDYDIGSTITIGETTTGFTMCSIEKTSATLKARVSGDYIFKLDWSSSYDCPTIDVTFPPYYTVTFNMNGRGSSIDPKYCVPNGTVSAPTDPTAANYIFGGWYDNAACTGSAFDFSSAINANTTLYAKWTFDAPTYYYRGIDNSWGATLMTPSDDHMYAYIKAKGYNSAQENQNFKITTANSWENWYGQANFNWKDSKIESFNGSDITNMGKWGSGDDAENAYIYNPADFYILVYYPNTQINTKSDPVICASTSLPGNFYVAGGVQLYFDNSVTDWAEGKQYLRIGRDNHNTAVQMTKVTGTDNLYECTVPAYNNYFAFTIANAAGWTNDNTIYQPSDKQPTGEYAITAELDYQRYLLDAPYTLTPTTGSGPDDKGCTYWGVNKQAGMKMQNVAISAYEHGSVAVAYTDIDGSSISDFTSGSRDVAHTCILTSVAATPATGYNLSALKINGSDHTSGNSYTVSSATTIAATFAAKTYAITLDANGGNSDGSATATYDSNTLSNITHVGARNGYTLKGYYTTASSDIMVADTEGKLVASVDGYTDAAGNWIKDAACTLVAQWQPQTYTISYTLNGGAWVNGYTAPGSYTFGTAPVLPTADNITRTGYTFKGWDKSITAETYGNQTLSAQWTANHYTVTLVDYDGNGGSAGITVTYDQECPSDAIKALNVGKTGYDFGGFGIFDGDNYENYIKLDGSTYKFEGSRPSYTESQKWVRDGGATFTAKWTAHQNTLTWEYNGGTVVIAGTAAGQVAYGTALTAPILEKTGYSYTWSPAVPSNMPDEDVTCGAIWTINKYALTWNFDGGSTTDESYTQAGDVEYNAVITYPETSTMSKSGYKFSGWDTDITNMPAAPTTIKALWTELITPTVTWNKVPTDVYAGGKYELQVTATTDADLTSGVSFATDDDDNATITGLAVNNATKVITAYLEMDEDADAAPVLTLTLPAGEYTLGGNFTNTAAEKSIKFQSCYSSAEYEIVLEDHEPVNNWNELQDVGRVANKTGGNAWSGNYSCSPTAYQTGSSHFIVQVYKNISGLKIQYYSSSIRATSSIKTGTSTSSLNVLSTEKYTADSQWDRNECGKIYTINFTEEIPQNTFINIVLGGNIYVQSVTLITPPERHQDKSPSLAWADGTADKGSTTRAYADGAIKLNAEANTVGTISYTCSPSGVVTVGTDGTVTPVAAGTATITATLASVGCFKGATITRSITITYPDCETPTISADPVGATYCAGETITPLSITASVAADETIHYQWKKDGTNVGTDAATYTPTEAGTYTCVVTAKREHYNDKSTTSEAAEIVINALPTPTISETEITTIPGTPVTLTAGGGTSYQWYSCSDDQKANATILTGETIAEYTFTKTEQATYYYFCVVTNANGCSAETDVATVIVSSKTTVTLSQDDATTQGTTSVEAYLNAPMPTATMPQRTGYNFAGYFDQTGGAGKQYYTAAGASANDWDKSDETATLFAHWIIQSYSVTANLSHCSADPAIPETANYDSSISTTISANKGYNLPTSVSVSGATLDSWSETGALSITNVTGAVTITVTAVAQQYNITYLDQGGAVFSGEQDDAPTKHTYGTATTLKTPTKLGYKFAGWYTNSECTGSVITSLNATAYTADITLYAKWQEDFAITADFATEAKKDESQRTPIADFLSNHHYTITSGGDVSWDAPSDKPADAGLKIKTTNHLISFFVPAGKKVTITMGTLEGTGNGTADLSKDGGKTYTTDALKGAATASYGDPFDNGPYKTTELTHFVIKITNANNKWNILNKITIEDDTYSVTYNGNTNTSGAAPVDNNAYLKNAEVTVLGNGTLAKTGYSFNNWNTLANGSGTSYRESDKFSITENVTLYAQWSVNSYNLSWNWDGGATTSTTHTQGTVPFGSTITYPAPNTMSKDGYIFSGWSTSATTMPASDLEITAQWTPYVALIGVTLDKENIKLGVGATAALSATPVPANASGVTYAWTTDNDAVATVANGVVTATGAGSATITVTATDAKGATATATCTVKVKLSEQITWSDDAVFYQGGKGTITATGLASAPVLSVASGEATILSQSSVGTTTTAVIAVGNEATESFTLTATTDETTTYAAGAFDHEYTLTACPSGAGEVYHGVKYSLRAASGATTWSVGSNDYNQMVYAAAINNIALTGSLFKRNLENLGAYLYIMTDVLPVAAGDVINIVGLSESSFQICVGGTFSSTSYTTVTGNSYTITAADVAKLSESPRIYIKPAGTATYTDVQIVGNGGFESVYEIYRHSGDITGSSGGTSVGDVLLFSVNYAYNTKSFAFSAGSKLRISNLPEVQAGDQLYVKGLAAGYSYSFGNSAEKTALTSPYYYLTQADADAINDKHWLFIYAEQGTLNDFRIIRQQAPLKPIIKGSDIIPATGSYTQGQGQNYGMNGVAFYYATVGPSIVNMTSTYANGSYIQLDYGYGDNATTAQVGDKIMLNNYFGYTFNIYYRSGYNEFTSLKSSIQSNYYVLTEADVTKINSVTTGTYSYDPQLKIEVMPNYRFTDVLISQMQAEQTPADLHWDADPAPTEVEKEGIEIFTIAAVSDNAGGAISYTSSNEDVATVDATGKVTTKNVEGTTTITAHIEAGGCFTQPEDITYTLKVTHIDDLNIFTNNNGEGDGYWETETNWSLTRVPNLTHRVIIEADATVNSNPAIARSVVINEGVQLAINPTAALVVTETIKSGADYESDLTATSVNQIYIKSSASGTGALIFDNSDGLAKATVEYYSIASGAPTNTQWQWATTPFSDENDVQYNYYGAWLSPWVNTTKGWGAMMKNGDGMTPFWGYCISRKEAGTFWMQGTLVSTEDRVQSLDYSGTTKRAGLNIIGNSWSAPINIHQWEVSDFVNAEATIVILNTGMDSLGTGSVGMTNSGAGQYISIPVKASQLMSSELQVIPAMQAFQVRATSTGASIQMNYDQLVRKSNGGIDIQPMRAPSRAANDDIDPAEVVTLRIDIKGSRFNDFLYLFQHNQFTDAVDNGWDGEKMLGSEDAVQLYVLPQSGKLAVSAQPELVGTQFGFYRGEDESYTITFDYNGTDRLYLHDANTDTYTEVKNGNSYTFSSYTYDLEYRFSLTDTNPHASVITGNDEVTSDEAPFKFIENEKLKIRANGQLFDGTGKMMRNVIK